MATNPKAIPVAVMYARIVRSPPRLGQNGDCAGSPPDEAPPAREAGGADGEVSRERFSRIDYGAKPSLGHATMYQKFCRYVSAKNMKTSQL